MWLAEELIPGIKLYYYIVLDGGLGAGVYGGKGACTLFKSDILRRTFVLPQYSLIK